jgi:tRNA-splicing ligase RtcB (3'-phosphate/5'-hydroxy nucleic acid ligase)
MIDRANIQKIDDYRFLIPRHVQHGMRTDALIYADENLLEHILKDRSLEQAANVAALPGIVGRSLAMPDIHQGYGFPIGGVAATDYNYGVVSPGGVGFDINCGVRLLGTSLNRGELKPRLQDVVDQIFRDVPCGTGGEGHAKLRAADLDRILVEGSQWMVENGFGEGADTEFTESRGVLHYADPDKVSERARQRGRRRWPRLAAATIFWKCSTWRASSTTRPLRPSESTRDRWWS